ncbi:helix-turn-helix domain-containing protein [Thiomicrospira sp. ALE5]|uniref:helix-turn-helix domain-containing protein n=1 Tax=Thiomicrospira sp. ALE5 TaxID=748650 RepID=UPI0008E1F894|nr:helix-turn-helix transcriptional regulator [Thiomicrospira sp. ALE5]SFR53549.1 Helix-turn-helix domain-containing protein [Thiomicrospira sp. ALE5]
MAKPLPCDIDIAIGKQIQRRRKELGISADELSECIDVSQQQFSRYERAQSKIAASQLKQVADATQTDVGWFYLGAKTIPVISLIAEDHGYYQSYESKALRNRLEQAWPMLHLDQQKAIIQLIDTFIMPH